MDSFSVGSSDVDCSPATGDPTVFEIDGPLVVLLVPGCGLACPLLGSILHRTCRGMKFSCKLAVKG
jgi:hypothetical protein